MTCVYNQYFDFDSICKINQVPINKKNKASFERAIEKIYLFTAKQGEKELSEVLRIMRVSFFYHNGLRKGCEIPEFQHMLDIAVDVIKMKNKIENAGLSSLDMVKIALMHDLFEDYHKKSEIWENEIHRLKNKPPVPTLLIEYLSGNNNNVAQKTLQMSKVDKEGKSKKSKHYYRELGLDPILIVLKMLDRKNSFTTMVGVFDIEKQDRYIDQYKRKIQVLAENFETSSEKMKDLLSYVLQDLNKTIDFVLKKRIDEKRLTIKLR